MMCMLTGNRTRREWRRTSRRTWPVCCLRH